MKNNLTVLFIFLNVTFSYTQADVTNDTIYRYTVSYSEDYQEVNKLSLYMADFPCVEKLQVVNSDNPQIDEEWSRHDGYKEFYKIGEDKITYMGHNGKDPFFDIEDNYIQYIGGVVEYFDANDPGESEQGTALYFLQYEMDDLPVDVQLYMLAHDYTKLRINNTISWKTVFTGHKENTMTGERLDVYSIQETRSISKVEFKAKKWTEVDKLSMDFYDKYLSAEFVEYQNYYDPNRFLTKRIQLSPRVNVRFQTKEFERPLRDCSTLKSNIYLFPNPTYGKLRLQMQAQKGMEYTLTLYNIAGQDIWETSIMPTSNDFNTTLDVPMLSKGIYIYGLRDRDGVLLDSKRITVIEP